MPCVEENRSLLNFSLTFFAEKDSDAEIRPRRNSPRANFYSVMEIRRTKNMTERPRVQFFLIKTVIARDSVVIETIINVCLASKIQLLFLSFS